MQISIFLGFPFKKILIQEKYVQIFYKWRHCQILSESDGRRSESNIKNSYGRKFKRNTIFYTKMRTKSYQLIIFDLDGVLINSIGVCEKAFNFAYEKVGLHGEPPFEKYRNYLGWRLPDIISEMGLPNEMVGHFVFKSKELINEIELFDGVLNTLEYLRYTGRLVGVATGKSGYRAREIMLSLGILQYFNFIVGSDEVEFAKPHPDSLQKHLNYFSIEPSDALYIGDATSDIKAGKLANIDVAAAMWGDGEHLSLTSLLPDYCIEKISDLPLLLNSPVTFRKYHLPCTLG